MWKPEDNISLIPQKLFCLPFIFVETVPLPDLVLTMKARLAGQEGLGISLCLFPQLWIPRVYHSASFLTDLMLVFYGLNYPLSPRKSEQLPHPDAFVSEGPTADRYTEALPHCHGYLFSARDALWCLLLPSHPCSHDTWEWCWLCIGGIRKPEVLPTLGLGVEDRGETCGS